MMTARLLLSFVTWLQAPEATPSPPSPPPSPSPAAPPVVDASDRPPPAGPAVAPEQPPRLASWNYLHVSPLSLGFTPVADAGLLSYSWGLAAGHVFSTRRRFAAALGGFAEHALLYYFAGDCVDPCGSFAQHELHIGPEVRIGGQGRRIFAYGVGRIGAALTLDYDVEDLNLDTGQYDVSHHYAVYPWVWGSVGPGIQGLIGRRLLVGGEQTFDIGGDAWFVARLRVFVGLRF